MSKSKAQVVGMMSEWSGVIKDIFRQINDGSLTLEQLQAFAEHCNPFAITDIRQEWQEFYRKYLRKTVDFSDFIIPADQGGFSRVIFISKGLTMNKVIKALRKQFEVSLYIENLDWDVTENVRKPDKSYAIRIREQQEADEELKNLSANQLKEQGVNCITLLERLVYELKYWSETSQHLDMANWTLCSGSRRSDGDVPYVGWSSDGDRLQVGWCDPCGALSSLRTRQAVFS